MFVCPELEVYEGFYDAVDSLSIFKHLRNEHDWPDNHYSVGERQFTLPRLQTWHADVGIRYSYSNNLLLTRPWTPLLTQIRAKVEAYLHHQFNSVLVNCYRDGHDYVGWHADNEAELGEQPVIASVSFGAQRYFAYRHKQSMQEGALLLQSGSLLLMRPDFQHHWLHRVPVDEDLSEARINLTFRTVIPR